MTQAELSTENMAFHPMCIAAKARQCAGKLLDSPGITAIIASNSIAVEALIQLLCERGQPMSSWPAIVGFDSQNEFSRDEALRLVTTLSLPWDEIGREAATLLWERSQGHLTGAPQQSLVSMKLIPRLSCCQKWHRTPFPFFQQKTISAVC